MKRARKEKGPGVRLMDTRRGKGGREVVAHQSATEKKRGPSRSVFDAKKKTGPPEKGGG